MCSFTVTIKWMNGRKNNTKPSAHISVIQTFIKFPSFFNLNFLLLINYHLLLSFYCVVIFSHRVYFILCLLYSCSIILLIIDMIVLFLALLRCCWVQQWMVTHLVAALCFEGNKSNTNKMWHLSYLCEKKDSFLWFGFSLKFLIIRIISELILAGE